VFFFSSRRRHTRSTRDWSSDVCSSDLTSAQADEIEIHGIAAAHPTVERDESGRCRFLGYIVRWNGLTLYHSGDTLWHPGVLPARSEERRVGKECRCRWARQRTRKIASG